MVGLACLVVVGGTALGVGVIESSAESSIESSVESSSDGESGSESNVESNSESSSEMASATSNLEQVHSIETTNGSENGISISAKYDSGKVDFVVSNNTDGNMYDVELVFLEDNRWSAAEDIIWVGDIGSGENKELSSGVVNVGSFFRGVCRYFGGYIAAGMYAVACIAVVGVAVVVAIRKLRSGGKLTVGYLSCVITGGVLLILVAAMSGGSSELYRLDSLSGNGERYVMPIATYTDGYDLRYSLEYCADEVEYKVSESEKTIPFEVTYEYDDTIPCTDEPIVKTEGVNGSKSVRTVSKYVNGKFDSKEVEETIITEPSTEVQVIGTKTVVQTENIDANITYVPDSTLMVGEFSVNTVVSDLKNNVGKKEVTYTWDSEKGEVVSSEVVTKEPGTNVWNAGTLVANRVDIPHKIEYVANEEEEIGYSKVTQEGKDGYSVIYYTTEIDSETGEAIEDSPLVYSHSDYSEPVTEVIEVGVLKKETVTTECDVEYEYDDEMWDNEETVKEEGKDKIEEVESILKLDPITGKVTDTVVKELSREVTQESKTEIRVKGSKEPNWVEEKIATDEVQFNTVYVADDELSGDEQEVVQEGQNGRLYTTQLVAVDDEGNILEGYEPKVIEEDVLSRPTDEIIHVAPDSKLLQENKES